MAASLDWLSPEERAEFERQMEANEVRHRAEEIERRRIEREFEEMAAREQAFREQRRQRFAEQRRAGQRHELPFIETSVSALIRNTLDRCLTFVRSGLVIGSPGIGKSRALHEIVRRGRDGEGPEAALIEVSGISGNSVKAILEDVCTHVGVEPATNINDTARRLVRQVDFAPVLLFDEAQNLGLTPARLLLQISEDTGIIMLFCGNAKALKLVSAKQADIEQIARRLPIREEITCILDTDADLIADHFRVVDIEARQICRELGSLFHADGVARVLIQARHDIGTEKPIRIDDIHNALDILPQFRAGLMNAAAVASRTARKSSLKPLVGRRG